MAHTPQYSTLLNNLQNYLTTPSIMTFNIFSALLDNQIIDAFTYRQLKKEWNKIQYIKDEVGASYMTNYDEFNYHMNKLIKQCWNWHYTIGTFPIPDGQVKVLLSCRQNIKSKYIHVLAYQNDTAFEVENDHGILYSNLDKIIALCNLLNRLNQCKKCRIVSVNVSTLGYCLACQNKSATVIQVAWRECISNPEYNICSQRLMKEFTELL